MVLVQLEDSVDLYAEDCVGDHVHNVDHQQTINEIGQRQVIIEPIDDTNLLGRKDRYFP